MARPATAPTSYSVKINGKDLYDYGVLVYSAPHLEMAPADVVADPLPERHGAFAFTSTFRPKPFVLTGTIFEDTATGLRTNLDALKTDLSSVRGKQFTIPETIRVEFADQTDRYYPCLYAGGFNLQPIGGHPTTDPAFPFTLPLIQLTPFAVATTLTTVTPSGTGPSFTVLDTGTAPNPFVLELEGAATAPDFVLADMSLYVDFDWDLVGTLIDGTSVTGASGATTDSDQFEPGERGGRYIAEATFGTTFAGVVSNPDEGTIIMVVRPQFAYDVAGNQFLAEWFVDEDNGVYLWYQASSDKFFFTRDRATVGVVTGATAAVQTFATDTRMVLAGSWGPNDVRLYKDGTLLDSDTGTTGVVGSSGTLYLGDQDAVAQPACKYDVLGFFPFQLSDADVRRYSLNPDLMRAHNVKFSKTGNLAANVREVLDFEKGTITQVSTTLVQTNGLSDWNKVGFPLLRPNQTCLHVPTGESIGGMKVAYWKRYL
ncbi:MAG: hypothetical protein A3E78_02825 [Alphaproteobacteria bacterium RIFCSPHIGHO2_12_FULL_63_12]|nr:MAG: hypothetical protein A3E78_02825 [Alphaproteobacteria bacterium RIFCSPHIGHO2_12_FULL_63_12]